MFQYSMMSYTVARQLPGGKADVTGLCKLTRELGLDAIDFVGLYDTEPKEVRRIADSFGLKIICYTFGADLHGCDAGARAAGLETVRRELEVAQILGTSLVMLPYPAKTGMDRDTLRRQVIEGLKDAVKLGTAAGITLSIEHFPQADSPFVTAKDINEALEQVPELRVTFDNGNCLTGGDDPAAAFLSSRDKIVFAHFKDWRLLPAGAGRGALNGKFYAPELIGRGIINYPSLLKTMRDADYRGYINIEYEGDDIPAPQAIREALDYLRRIEPCLL